MSGSQEDHEKSYGDGAKDSKEAGATGHVAHDFDDLLMSVIPHWESTTYKSYEAGWHDQENGKVAREGNNSSSNGAASTSSTSYGGSYGGSSSSDVGSSISGAIGKGFGIVVALVVVGLVVGVIWLFVAWNIEINANSRRGATTPPPPGKIIGTMRETNTIKLNMRSGPGASYPVVKTFVQGERIVSIGQPQDVSGEVWIRAATPDGQVMGWVNRKYIRP